MKKRIYAGIDIGGTKIATALVTASGKILCRAKSSTPKNASAAKIVRIIVDLVDDMLCNCDAEKRDISGIGIGVPGLVEMATGRIVRTPNMGLSGTGLQKLLKKKFRVKIALGNDVNLGVLGEKWMGSARKSRNVVGLFVGTGLGGGVIVDGRLVTGTHGAAAEMGHMIIRDDGPKCSCGNRGCLEAHIGRWAIERDIKKAMASGEKTMVSSLIDKKTGSIKSKALRKALRKKDPVVTAIMKEACGHLGAACISVRHIFDPEVIILGGGVIEACGEFMLPIVLKVYQKDKLFIGLGECEIRPSVLGDDAIMLGGVALVRGLA